MQSEKSEKDEKVPAARKQKRVELSEELPLPLVLLPLASSHEQFTF